MARTTKIATCHHQQLVSQKIPAKKKDGAIHHYK
jgi:hypothetical protein